MHYVITKTRKRLFRGNQKLYLRGIDSEGTASLSSSVKDALKWPDRSIPEQHLQWLINFEEWNIEEIEE